MVVYCYTCFVCVGGELGSELVDWEKILEEPNTFLTLSEFLKDSDKLSEYLSKNCTDTEVSTTLLTFWVKCVCTDGCDVVQASTITAGRKPCSSGDSSWR